ncbi:hypothetical protein M404DRAFT_28457 [Pisolithus tinctorius Marx 270]|uniref:Uncharacterized protein n=1 Tax=Pisolithus tinctorius Marx 270 TaxID=870435 RepID=A0A0C3P2K2_PISTI|nr:hypothetical protein M404DRAFT_28457 [Pisolithus tinctorius Marx 270]
MTCITGLDDEELDCCGESALPGHLLGLFLHCLLDKAEDDPTDDDVEAFASDVKSGPTLTNSDA